MSDCTQRVLSFSVPICTNCHWKQGTCVLEVKVIWFGNLNDTRVSGFTYLSLPESGLLRMAKVMEPQSASLVARSQQQTR